MFSNVFLIATPLQALNAIEACYAFGLAPKDVLMIFAESGSEANNRQTRRMLADEVWGAVQDLRYCGATLAGWIGRLRTLNRIARTASACERLFLGDYGFDLARHLSNILKPQNTVLLDDGAATLNVWRTRVNPDHPKFYFLPPNATPAKRRLKRILGMRDDLLDKVTYFTVYELCPEEGSSYVRNTYRHLIARSGAKREGDSLFFLGSPMTELEGVSEERYDEILWRALKHLGEFENLSYLPHRNESTSRLDRLVRTFGFKVMQFDAPIEYALCCLAGTLPTTVAGFVSSAFINLNVLFGERMELRIFHFPVADATIADVAYTEFDAYVKTNFRAPHLELIDL